MKVRFGSPAASPTESTRTRAAQSVIRPTHLYLVNGYEVESLRAAVVAGGIPQDFKTKLGALAMGRLNEAILEQRCRTLIELLIVAHDGSFRHITKRDCDHLLQVLAYVRKDDDAIPDYRPDGFADDQQEVRAAFTELLPLLEKFKAWRLQHQVPNLWRQSLPSS